MIVGFSKHSTGSGSAVVDYLVDEDRPGREAAKPEVLSGDPELTANLIDTISFKRKYTSGVLSFAPGENIAPKQEQAIMDRFESLAFSGLDKDQYCILWVRHKHAAHHELHFVTPRIELSTCKSLNINPPGTASRKHFDDLRSEINARYGLADPTDPSRAHAVATPDHELKIAAEALRSSSKPPDNMRVLVDQVLSQRALQGLIRSREDVLEHVKDLGFDVARAGKDYITVRDAQSNQRWRLKGALYAADYELGRTLEVSAQARERDYTKPDARAANDFAKRVEQHISTVAKYNQKRYAKPTSEPSPSNQQDDVETLDVAQLSRPELPSGHSWHGLGNHPVLPAPDFPDARDSREAKRQRRESASWLLQPASMRTDQTEIKDIRGWLQDLKRVLDEHHRVRKSLAERIKKLAEAMREATAVIGRYAERNLLNNKRNNNTKQIFTESNPRTEHTGRDAQQVHEELEREELETEPKSMPAPTAKP